MPINISQAMLILQRAAVMRAINVARERRADNDAEMLQSVVHLLEELHDLVTWQNRKRKDRLQ